MISSLKASRRAVLGLFPTVVFGVMVPSMEGDWWLVVKSGFAKGRCDKPEQ